MVMNVKVFVRGRRRGIVLKAENKLELQVYTRILNKLLSCNSPDEIDTLLAHY